MQTRIAEVLNNIQHFMSFHHLLSQFNLQGFVCFCADKVYQAKDETLKALSCSAEAAPSDTHIHRDKIIFRTIRAKVFKTSFSPFTFASQRNVVYIFLWPSSFPPLVSPSSSLFFSLSGFNRKDPDAELH